MATFEHFYKSLSSNSQVRGKEFEKLVKWFLQTDPRWNNLVKKVWLWDEHPQRDEWGPDCGIDLVFEDLIGNIWAVQAKCFDSHNSIRKEHMDSFIAESSDSRFQKRLLVTSTDSIGPNVERLLSRHKVVKILLEDLVNADLEYPENPKNFKNAKRKDPPKPYPHQEEAIKDVLNGLKDKDKGQVLMACGTGKTLTSLWIKERLKAKNTLVLLPSLSLLSQTLKEWHKASKEPFKWICVCSDKSVAKQDKSNDDWIQNISEIGLPVTSNVQDIKKFLCEIGSKIIFSTYQSSPLIVEAQNDLKIPKFEIVFADEAHRCAGKVSSAFSSVLDDNKIRSKKKLFFTATPVILSNQIKAQASANDIEIASMDDISKFGNIFHQLKFSDAISRDPPLLTDYQVVIVGVDDPLIQQHILNRSLLTIDGEDIYDAESLAASVSVIKSIKEYNLKRIISFHNKVKNAEKFASETEDIFKFIPIEERPSLEVKCEHVAGFMNSNKRNKKLKRLKNLKPNEARILSNSRCLSEGVDVPTLDGVAFIDPRSSQIDIIQAVGRAIRKSKDKKLGTIIIPVYLGDSEKIEEAMIESRFNNVWKIILALKSQDDSLMEKIDQLRVRLGKGGGNTRGGGLEKIIIIPERINNKFVDSIRTLLVRNCSEDWYEKYGNLVKFSEENGHANPPQKEKSIGQWVSINRQNYKKEKLSKKKIELLEKLNGWVWDSREAEWEEKYRVLKDFAKGKKFIVTAHTLPILGRWVTVQRREYEKGHMPPERISLLEKLEGWRWDPFEEKWYEQFNQLKEYVEKNGHAQPPKKEPIIGHWVQKQRYNFRHKKLTQEKINLLTELKDWSWNSKVDSWMEQYNQFKKLIEKNAGGMHSSNQNILRWKTKQKSLYKKGMLTKNKIELLEKIDGWIWGDINEKIWEEKYNKLKNNLLSKSFNDLTKESKAIRVWIAVQRREYKRKSISNERILLLEKLNGWQWDPLHDLWMINYLDLKNKYHQGENIKTKSKLYSWIRSQKNQFKKGTLKKDQVRLLEELKNWNWDY